MKGRSEVGWQLEEGTVKGWKRAIIIYKDLDHCDIEWFALETNRDHSVIF